MEMRLVANFLSFFLLLFQILEDVSGPGLPPGKEESPKKSRRETEERPTNNADERRRKPSKESKESPTE